MNPATGDVQEIPEIRAARNSCMLNREIRSPNAEYPGTDV